MGLNFQVYIKQDYVWRRILQAVGVNTTGNLMYIWGYVLFKKELETNEFSNSKGLF
jgi:hypothetical protein